MAGAKKKPAVQLPLPPPKPFESRRGANCSLKPIIDCEISDRLASWLEPLLSESTLRVKI